MPRPLPTRLRRPASAFALSLLDPAYFATTLAGGWFASGADAVLTALLLAGTTLWAWRRLAPGAERSARWQSRVLLIIPAAALAAVGLHHLWTDLAANANARLLGLQVPLGAWTFWALHGVILAISLAVGALLVLGGLRLLGGRPHWFEGPARPYLLVAGLLTCVLVNYAVLSRSYGRAERDWLRRKAEQIVQPQDEWISFLVEDVLNDMAGQDTAGIDPTEAGPGRGALGRDRLAHRLWRRSAVRDLGLPGLVEVLDAAGRTESLYATGFLRDFSYEVVERSEWWALSGAPPDDPEREGVLLQDERAPLPHRGWSGCCAARWRATSGGWLRLELSTQSLRISTLLGRLTGAPGCRAPAAATGRAWRSTAPSCCCAATPNAGSTPGSATCPARRPRPSRGRCAGATANGRTWSSTGSAGSAAGRPCPTTWPAATRARGFLLGLQRRGAVEVMLDLGRLLLLDVVLMLAGLVALAAVRRRWRWAPGFQGRFLAGYLVIGVVLLVVAGVLADRQTFERIDRDARARTRDGLVTAISQLRGLLAEQARALASSDYMAELLAGRLAGERRLGPFSVRQAMVFAADGELLLDETLSDLDPAAAARLLMASREAPLLVMQQPSGVYLGVTIPIDLGGVLEEDQATGTFFYRQRVDDQLLPGLAEVVGGEVVLRLDGEVIDASHPGRVLDQPALLLADPDLMRWYREHPGQPRLEPSPTGLAFTGGIALPALSPGGDGNLSSRTLPAVLAVEFPDRERDFTDERRSMALFLAGLITLLLLTAFGLAMALTWNIFEPLRVLLAATRQLAAGDYTAPLPPGGGDEVGRLASGFGAMRDQLQNAREVLESRERFLRAVLERVPVGVLVWDRVGRLAAWNPAAGEILARFYPDVAATGDLEVDVAAWTARLRCHLAAQLRDGTGELSSDDGRRTLRVGQAPVELGDDAPHRLVVCEDLTEFLAAKKQALNAELARQVAHEIKNPLTPIQLSAQLVQQAWQGSPPRASTRSSTTRCAGSSSRSPCCGASPASSPCWAVPATWSANRSICGPGARHRGRLPARAGGRRSEPASRWRRTGSRRSWAIANPCSRSSATSCRTASTPEVAPPSWNWPYRGKWHPAPCPSYGRTTARGSIRTWLVACLTRIFPPRARAPAWAWPSAATCWTRWAAPSPWRTAPGWRGRGGHGDPAARRPGSGRRCILNQGDVMTHWPRRSWWLMPAPLALAVLACALVVGLPQPAARPRPTTRPRSASPACATPAAATGTATPAACPTGCASSAAAPACPRPAPRRWSPWTARTSTATRCSTSRATAASPWTTTRSTPCAATSMPAASSTPTTTTASTRPSVTWSRGSIPIAPGAPRADHPIYSAFYELPGLPKIHEHDGDPAQGFGIQRQGRLVVFYSWSSDIGDGLEDPDVHNDPPDVREAATRMACNILMYALTNP